MERISVKHCIFGNGRNDLAHAYKEEVAATALKHIQHDYFIAIQQVYTWLKKQNNSLG